MHVPAKLWNEEHRALLARLLAATSAGHAQEAAEFVAAKAALARRNRYYLARSFDEAAKYDCARFHYAWLIERLQAQTMQALLTEGLTIWAAEPEGVRYLVSLCVETYVAREGELTLEMWAGRMSLYMLSFSFVPARLFGLDAEAALLISRVQGRPERFEEIRLATKSLAELQPRAVLFAALTGIAEVFGIGHVAGVTGENYINFLDDKREALERQYDGFFATLDAEGPANGFHLIDLGAEPKPVNAQKAGHRIRTRRKRQLKREIADAVAGFLSGRTRAP